MQIEDLIARIKLNYINWKLPDNSTQQDEIRYENWFRDKHSMISCAKVLLSYHSPENHYHHFLTEVGVFTQHYYTKPRYSMILSDIEILPELVMSGKLNEFIQQSGIGFRVWDVNIYELSKIDKWRKGKFTINKHSEAVLDTQTLRNLNGGEFSDARYYMKRWANDVKADIISIKDVSEERVMRLIDRWKMVKEFRNNNYKEVGLKVRVPLATSMYRQCLLNGGIGLGFIYDEELVGIVQGFIDKFNRGYLTTAITQSNNPEVRKYSVGVIMPIVFSDIMRNVGVEKINYGDFSRMNNFIRATKSKLRPEIVDYYTMEVSKGLIV